MTSEKKRDLSSQWELGFLVCSHVTIRSKCAVLLCSVCSWFVSSSIVQGGRKTAQILKLQEWRNLSSSMYMMHTCNSKLIVVLFVYFHTTKYIGRERMLSYFRFLLFIQCCFVKVKEECLGNRCSVNCDARASRN